MNQQLLEEIGQILYQKRIKKKYSLEQISEITKVSIKNLEFIEFIETTIKSLLKKKNILFIFVNYERKVLEELKNIRCIESYYINDTKGYSIYCLNNN